MSLRFRLEIDAKVSLWNHINELKISETQYNQYSAVKSKRIMT